MGKTMLGAGHLLPGENVPIPSDILPIVYLDGTYMPAREARISALDRGFLVADGFFETLHVFRGAPVEFDGHMRRLENSAAFMSISLPWSRQDLGEVIAHTLRRNGLVAGAEDEAAVRLTVTRGETLDGPPSLFLYIRKLAPDHLAKRTLGLALYQLPWHGRGDAGLAQHKTLSYLASALGQLWLREHAPEERSEGLFVSSSGDVLEGTASNVFVVEDETLATPPLSSGVLAGTSRAVVLELAEGLGLTAHEASLPLKRLTDADEVFITSSTLHLAPVLTLDEAIVGGGRRGPVVERLQTAFTARVTGEVSSYWSARGEVS